MLEGIEEGHDLLYRRKVAFVDRRAREAEECKLGDEVDELGVVQHGQIPGVF